jgi:hypothetical protein
MFVTGVKLLGIEGILRGFEKSSKIFVANRDERIGDKTILCTD